MTATKDKVASASASVESKAPTAPVTPAITEQEPPAAPAATGGSQQAAKELGNPRDMFNGAFDERPEQAPKQVPEHPLELRAVRRPSLKDLKQAAKDGSTVGVRSLLDPIPSNHVAPGVGIVGRELRHVSLADLNDEQLRELARDQSVALELVED